MNYRIYVLGVCALVGVFFVSGNQALAVCDINQVRTTSLGDRGAHVSVLQSCLIQAGYSLSSGATGYYGSQTQAAVKAFYSSALNMPELNGQSFGPKAKTALMTRVQSGGAIGTVTVGGTKGGLVRATNEADLLRYFAKVKEKNTSQSFRGNIQATMEDDISESSDSDSDSSKSDSSPSRVSDTNVQVAGIDEPDIVKTDGTTIYVARQGRHNYLKERYQYEPGNVTAVTATPLEELGIASEAIEEEGEMLLVKDKKILIVLSYNEINAYDVSDPKRPQKKWSTQQSEGTQMQTARLNNGVLYLVTSTHINFGRPCPISPFTRDKVAITIPCGDIWMPTVPESTNQSYSIFAIDPVTGKENRTTTVLGGSYETTVYMNDTDVYLAHRIQDSRDQVTLRFYKEQLGDILSKNTIDRMRMIDGYDISLYSKLYEMEASVQRELSGYSENVRLKTETKIADRLKKFMEQNQREIDRTQIVRLPLDTLVVGATAQIPGHLLNQFSLDEWNGNLRVAVTVGEPWWGFGGADSANDVYVLDRNLKVIGSVQDLGLDERIYAARFMGDRAYIVTFRQTDPFYVLDLSVPTAPKMVGELKIPGYSAYLEPLGKDRILGVGREDQQVKLSLFDVSDPKNPKELTKYSLKEYWSEVEGNHHAFLKDATHGVFFIPGGEGGYVFSYKDDKFELEAAVKGYDVQRAIYIDDYMFIIGQSEITVLDESTWEEVKTLKL